jgi:2-polyprenyl-6-methoxyphenol hydroxylase-like FAD-dependent oxidoreductase
VIIAGAGIGGLVLAVALLKQGVDVKVFERDLTAIRGEGKYRGPIQVREATGYKVACWGVVMRNVLVQLLAVPAGNMPVSRGRHIRQPVSTKTGRRRRGMQGNMAGPCMACCSTLW